MIKKKMPISPSVDLQKETKKVTTSIKRKLVTQMRRLLCRYGFVQTKNAVWNRYTHTLRQCFEFRQCRDKFDFRYGYNILDKYDHLYKISLNDCAYAWNIERSVNLPKSIDGVSSLVEELVNYIQQEGLLSFERYKATNDFDLFLYEHNAIKFDHEFWAVFLREESIAHVQASRLVISGGGQ